MAQADRELFEHDEDLRELVCGYFGWTLFRAAAMSRALQKHMRK